MRYRRFQFDGGTYFFTVVAADRRPLLTDALTISALRRSLARVRRKRPFDIDAIVVLPDHIHTIWTLPEGDSDFSTRWMLVKAEVTRDLHRNGFEGKVWQQRYWEHLIRDERDFAAHADYLHYNPVRHGHVNSPANWRWSSYSRWAADGRYAQGWGESDLEFGEGIGSE